MNKCHVGILGATSLVGEYLTQRLIAEHWHVTAFSRHPVAQTHPQVNWQQLAAPSHSMPDDTCHEIPVWLYVAPIWTAPEHFDLLLSYGIQRIIVLSSTSRFTKHSSSDPTEQNVAQRLARSEETVQAWAMSHEIDWIILRPTLIYGHGRDKNISEIAHFIQRFGFFPVLGSATGLRQPIHVDDVVAACFFALGTLNLKNRTYNLTGGETLTYRTMVQRIFEALDHYPRLLNIPLWIFQLTIQGLRWLPRYQHWTAAMAERMNQDLVFDCSDAMRDLNFSPRPFRLSTEDLPIHT